MKIYYCNAKTLLDESLFLQGMEYVDSGRRRYIWQLKNPLDKISFSHSGTLSATAYHIGDRPIGMDIQRMSSRKVKDHVAEYIMSESEYTEYCAADQSRDKCAFFYRILCCKEAYTKMTGEGILAFFGSLDVSEIKKKYHLYSSTIDWNGETYMLSACWNQAAEFINT